MTEGVQILSMEMLRKGKSTRTSIEVQSPGRINIIGEHTDYNDGFVLPAAIDKNIIIKLKRNESASNAQVQALNLHECFSFDLQYFSRTNNGWQNYILGVVHELQQLGAQMQGFDCEIEGDVPIGSGMSSSAALECSVAYGLNELFDLGFDQFQLIKAAQRAEHHFVGTKCGIMDQFASMMGKKGQVILLDCRSLEYHYFPLELGNYQILLLNTNVSHSLASSEYNTRRAECEEGVAILQQRYPDIKNLRDVKMEQLLYSKYQMREKIFQRCHHVITENQRVIDATQALQNGNLHQLGELMYQSHFSLQHDYEVSCPELDFLVAQTQNKDYILGARMMGGGFGGCTINIIEKTKLEVFVDQVSTIYKNHFGINTTPYTVFIEDGTNEIKSW